MYLYLKFYDYPFKDHKKDVFWGSFYALFTNVELFTLPTLILTVITFIFFTKIEVNGRIGKIFTVIAPKSLAIFMFHFHPTFYLYWAFGVIPLNEKDPYFPFGV